MKKNIIIIIAMVLLSENIFAEKINFDEIDAIRKMNETNKYMEIQLCKECNYITKKDHECRIYGYTIKDLITALKLAISYLPELYNNKIISGEIIDTRTPSEKLRDQADAWDQMQKDIKYIEKVAKYFTDEK